MAYCNINQYKAKRLIRIRNIDSIEQVELAFRASAYFAWSSQNPDSQINLLQGSFTSSLHKNNQFNLRKLRQRSKDNIGNPNIPDNDSNLPTGISNEDQTLIPQLVEEDLLTGRTAHHFTNSIKDSGRWGFIKLGHIWQQDGSCLPGSRSHSQWNISIVQR